jgi:hypothetical protein
VAKLSSLVHPTLSGFVVVPNSGVDSRFTSYLVGSSVVTIVSHLLKHGSHLGRD